ncbi:MAG TPA: 6-hydroxymethylpterin diphosphokinase MptE-like protein [Acidobacteriota bacterium]|nr:6-hydroxymethylpterin diphosphokinase MptE-like protein [Acidobacteriota bacterium]
MTCLEANLNLLSRRQPELAAHLRQISSGNVEVFPSTTGLPTASYRRGETVSSLHSRRNPAQEALRIVQKADITGADYFVLLGFGLGYILNALLEQESDAGENHYFVIESDMGILRAAFASRDLSGVLSLPHLHFAWPAEGPGLARQWETFFDPVRAQKNVFISHPPSIALDPGHFRSAVELIQSQTSQIFTDINTLVGRTQEFLDNFVQNLPRAMAAPGVSSFAGRFRDVPVVLVAAGPSLDKNIHDLRRSEDRVLIVSTDTAVKPLISTGIEPHFVLTGDPSHLNYLHLKDSGTREAYLVAEATSYPASLAEFEGRTIICIFENSSLRALSGLLGGKGMLRAWGSVATMALDFALLLGCNPVMFIGQDLAHSDGRIYCSGLHFEEQWFEGVSDPESWERKWQELRRGRKTLMMQDIFDRPVESTDKLAAYWNWIIKEIAAHPQVRFINATEGGILKERVDIMSLREALFRFCGSNLDLRRRSQDVFHEACGGTRRVQNFDLRLIREESAALSRILKRGLGMCDDITRTDAGDIFRRLEVVKADIYSNIHIAPIVDCFNQMGNVTFLRNQAALTKLPGKAASAEAVRSVYREYFETVQKCLQKIDTALLEISKAVD